jgi:hypothetical protein
MPDTPAATACHQSGWGTPLPLSCPKQNCCNSTTASLPSASPALSARDMTIPLEPQRGDLAQPRPPAWVKKVPILTLSPVRAKYEVRTEGMRVSVETSTLAGAGQGTLCRTAGIVFGGRDKPRTSKAEVRATLAFRQRHFVASNTGRFMLTSVV